MALKLHTPSSRRNGWAKLSTTVVSPAAVTGYRVTKHNSEHDTAKRAMSRKL